MVVFQLNCATGPVSGILFTNTVFPGTTNTDASIGREKKASGCIRNILGLFSYGQSGAGAIAFKEGITRISYIDHSATQVLLFVYRDYCTIVTGDSK
ncbi:TRL-like family protein [Leptospira perolatii]|uniref:TRL-like family protein n=2 Tax=Leptospira perolatii TaxID=2023191 RepID=A0A2M9ZQT9_9LEPT|nr:TRL-like family protein [Leptospira perolatii]PJZ74457.1 TRL-like family protein [Leptospira perolatii]